jgi:hypothetical protein
MPRLIFSETLGPCYPSGADVMAQVCALYQVRSHATPMRHAIRKSIAALLGAALIGPAVPQGATESALSLTVVVTAKGKELFNSWGRPTGKRFAVEPVGVARRGEFLSAVVLFKGCKPDAAGSCNVSMTITAYAPDGSEYGVMPDAELWQGKPSPSLGFTQLARDYMGIVVEPSDPSGTYRVTVVARDRNANTTASGEATFLVK